VTSSPVRGCTRTRSAVWCSGNAFAVCWKPNKRSKRSTSPLIQQWLDHINAFKRTQYQ
jgi:hypothetical protein